jgi:hypothetical protein
MATHAAHALRLSQTALDFEKGPDDEPISDDGIERRSAPVQYHEEDLDVLCLESACAGVLLSLWCEITIYARDYAVPECVLRAMVECAFLSELDRGLPFAQFEEDALALTRAKYVKVLRAAEQKEKVRLANAKYPYKTPEDKWKELLRKAQSERVSASAKDEKQGR